MTTAILVAGLAVTLLAAYVMRRAEWRLPALLAALFAIPGNVDNLLPQMRLDPNDIANNTAPIMSVVDLLIAWGLLLAMREGRFSNLRRLGRTIVVTLTAFAILAGLISVVNVAQGADPAAAARGVLTLLRIPAVVALAITHREALGDGLRLGLGAAVGLLALIGNGIFTSAQLGADRFTAATFGRNGFSLALVVTALVATGLGLELARRPGMRDRIGAAIAFALAAAGLFGAIATGTRMSLLTLPAAIVFCLLVNRTWWSRRGALAMGLVLAGAVVVSAGAVAWTAEGGRAISVVTDPGDTVDIITDPGGEPSYSPVRTRTEWWRQALEMAAGDPLTGIGPYQWNVRRYEIDPDAAEIVADPHNSYIQMAAEYGVVATATYVVLLGLLMLGILVSAWRIAAVSRWSAVAVTIAAAALLAPATEMTNSHLFNVRLGAANWLLLGVVVTLTVLPVVERGRAAAAAARHGPEVPPHAVRNA